MVVAETIVLTFIGLQCVKGGVGAYLYMKYGADAPQTIEEAMGCGTKPDIDDDDGDPFSFDRGEEKEEEEGQNTGMVVTRQASDCGVGGAVKTEVLEKHSKDGL